MTKRRTATARPKIAALDPESGEFVERDMTDDELAEWEATAASRSSDDVIAAGRRGELVELLRESDGWAARAVENGIVGLTAAQVAYRVELRDLHASVDPSAELVLPDPPAPPSAAELANASTLRDRLATLAVQLKTAADAASSSPPTLFAALPAAERQVLVRLLRSQLAMIRLQLRELDATD